jgi:hypothetical protein
MEILSAMNDVNQDQEASLALNLSKWMLPVVFIHLDRHLLCFRPGRRRGHHHWNHQRLYQKQPYNVKERYE